MKRKKEKLRLKKELDALIIKLKEKQKDKLIKSAEREYNINSIEDYNYEINSTGRYGFESYFTYTESLKLVR